MSGVFLENVDRGSNVANSGSVKNDELKSSDCQTHSKPVSWFTVGETLGGQEKDTVKVSL